jgi:hypothetical protein
MFRICLINAKCKTRKVFYLRNKRIKMHRMHDGQCHLIKRRANETKKIKKNQALFKNLSKVCHARYYRANLVTNYINKFLLLID